MSNRDTILDEIDSLYALAEAVMNKADGLRKKVLHFNAGPLPTRGRKKVDLAVQADVIEGLRKSLNRKSGK